jgi:hypothetical protein
MKKADLEKQLEEYRNMYYAKCSELNEQKKSHQNEIESIKKRAKEDAYKKWKSENEVFLKKFIKEYFLENMRFDEKTEAYSDWTTIKLNLDGTTIADFSIKERLY